MWLNVQSIKILKSHFMIIKIENNIYTNKKLNDEKNMGNVMYRTYYIEETKPEKTVQEHMSDCIRA